MLDIVKNCRDTNMLFLPWRNESVDILGKHDTFEQHYIGNSTIIQANQNKYEHFEEELEQARIQAE